MYTSFIFKFLWRLNDIAYELSYEFENTPVS